MISEYFNEYYDSKNENVKREFFLELWREHKRIRKQKRKVYFDIDIELDEKYQLLFEPFSCMEYHIGKNSGEFDYLGICINNLYAKYCDKDLRYSKKYYNAVYFPRKLYRYVVGNQESVNYDDVKRELDRCVEILQNEKHISILSKMDIKWEDFQRIVEEYLGTLFDRYIPVWIYEKEKEQNEILVYSNHWTEDNYVIGFLCKNLRGYMMDYYKKYHGVKRQRGVTYKNCTNCGKLFYKKGRVVRAKYCDDCRGKITRESWKKASKNYYHKAKCAKKSYI